LEPRRRKIGSQLLAAIQYIRSWRDAGFKPPYDYGSTNVTDAEVAAIYDICKWDNEVQ
jgi:hypothetical protein